MLNQNDSDLKNTQDYSLSLAYYAINLIRCTSLCLLTTRRCPINAIHFSSNLTIELWILKKDGPYTPRS